jgi:2-phosphosulfolactate phosphatase
MRIPGFDLGNSPEETLTPKGRELILATTNGAPAIVGAAAACDEVLVACLHNEDAVVSALRATTGDILILCAGTNGNVTVEDTYLAGRISAALDGPRTDAALIAEAVAGAYPKPIDALDRSAGAKQLYLVGLGSDVAYCAQVSTTRIVPRVIRTIGKAAVMEALASSERAASRRVPPNDPTTAAGIAGVGAENRKS